MYFGHLSTIPSPLKFSMHTLNGDHMASLFKSVSSKDCFHGDDCHQHYQFPNRGGTCISYSILVIRRIYTISYFSTEKPTSCENLTGFSSSTEVISVICK